MLHQQTTAKLGHQAFCEYVNIVTTTRRNGRFQCSRTKHQLSLTANDVLELQTTINICTIPLQARHQRDNHTGKKQYTSQERSIWENMSRALLIKRMSVFRIVTFGLRLARLNTNCIHFAAQENSYQRKQSKMSSYQKTIKENM